MSKEARAALANAIELPTVPGQPPMDRARHLLELYEDFAQAFVVPEEAEEAAALERRVAALVPYRVAAPAAEGSRIDREIAARRSEAARLRAARRALDGAPHRRGSR